MHREGAGCHRRRRSQGRSRSNQCESGSPSAAPTVRSPSRPDDGGRLSDPSRPPACCPASSRTLPPRSTTDHHVGTWPESRNSVRVPPPGCDDLLPCGGPCPAVQSPLKGALFSPPFSIAEPRCCRHARLQFTVPYRPAAGVRRTTTCRHRRYWRPIAPTPGTAKKRVV
jgi:hypothetical protein